MASSSTQSSATQYFYQLSAEELIEINYFQSDTDKSFTKITNYRCSHPNTFHVSLKVDQVLRKLFFSSEGTHTLNQTVYDAPIIEHCLPYVSNDQVCPDKLGQFRVATLIPEQIMVDVLYDLWSFAQGVVPVLTKDRGVMVQPFTMVIKHVKIEYYDRDMMVRSFTRWSLPNEEEAEEDEDEGTSEGYGFFEDCFEKVIFDRKNGEQSQSCSICLEDFASGMDLRRLPCSHIYHGDCIVKWLATKPACPLCRFTIVE